MLRMLAASASTPAKICMRNVSEITLAGRLPVGPTSWARSINWWPCRTPCPASSSVGSHRRRRPKIIDVVKNHLAENPEDWRNTAASIVGFAIMRAFPCGKYNGRREAAARRALWATRKRAKFCPAIFAKAPHRYSREPGCRAGIHGTYGDKAKPPRLTPSAVLLFVRRTRVAQ